MTEQYLILHKVRGEPAFDVAETLQVGTETYWIVSTSGHRAYPLYTWHMEDLADISDINSSGNHTRPARVAEDAENNFQFEGLLDHYQTVVRRKREAELEITADELDAILTSLAERKVRIR